MPKQLKDPKDREYTNLRVRKKDLQNLKIVAALQGMSMIDLIGVLATEAIKKKKAA